jgi:hypothetical protein
MSDLHFDPFQFAGRPHYAVSAEYTRDGWTSTGVDFSDGMSTQNSSVPRRCKRWTPAFAASPEKLRRVLLQRAWTYLYCKKPFPATADWKTINAAATKRALKPFDYKNCPTHKRGENEAHVAAVKRAGGYLQLLAAIAYRAWNLGQDSVAVADSLRINPQCVRQHLSRLCGIARALGFETFKQHHTSGLRRGSEAVAARKAELTARREAREKRTAQEAPRRERKARTSKHSYVNFDHAWIIELYQGGVTNLTDLAEQIGFPRGIGQGRCRKVLIDAGVFRRV